MTFTTTCLSLGLPFAAWNTSGPGSIPSMMLGYTATLTRSWSTASWSSQVSRRPWTGSLQLLHLQQLVHRPCLHQQHKLLHRQIPMRLAWCSCRMSTEDSCLPQWDGLYTGFGICSDRCGGSIAVLDLMLAMWALHFWICWTMWMIRQHSLICKAGHPVHWCSKRSDPMQFVSKRWGPSECNPISDSCRHVCFSRVFPCMFGFWKKSKNFGIGLPSNEEVKLLHLAAKRMKLNLLALVAFDFQPYKVCITLDSTLWLLLLLTAYSYQVWLKSGQNQNQHSTAGDAGYLSHMSHDSRSESWGSEFKLSDLCFRTSHQWWDEMNSDWWWVLNAECDFFLHPLFAVCVSHVNVIAVFQSKQGIVAVCVCIRKFPTFKIKS